jgi:hypothetical protein
MAEAAQTHIAALQSGQDGQRLYAAATLRDLAGDPASKGTVREAGGVQALLALLSGGEPPAITIAAVQALSCLAVDDMATQVGS